jgi:DNA-binding transcriptional regulator GbsR (MarR family)
MLKYVKLSPAAERFVLHWGEMGPKWGVNRSVAQVHALLYVAPEPITAEEIASTLGIARSNVSVSLKELLSWGIVRVVRVRIVMDERKKRELDPTLALLRECLDLEGAAVEKQRIRSMLSFFETMSTWYHQVRGMPMAAVKSFAKMGAKLRSLLGKGA